MIPRLFSSILTTLFLITTYGQSHSAESTEKLYIPESLSKISHPEQAIEFWKDHRHSSNLDRVAVRDQFSEINFEYQSLWKQGFDVLDVNAANKNDVFTNVSFVFIPNHRENRYGLDYDGSVGFEEERMLEIMKAIAYSQITILTIKGALTPKLGEALVTLLEEGKIFQKLKMSLCCEKFRGDDSIFQMIRKIGMAAKGKVDTLNINESYSGAYSFRSTKESPFDFYAFNVEDHLEKLKIADQKSREDNDAYNKKQRQEWEQKCEQKREETQRVLGLIVKGVAGVVAVGAVYYGMRFL